LSDEYVWSAAGLLASGTKFRDLLDHAGAKSWFAVSADELPTYLDRREAAVRAGSIPPTQIEFADGRRMLSNCIACPDGGRILTYVDISQELRSEARDAVEQIAAEVRFKTETLEDQASYLASLAEAATRAAGRSRRPGWSSSTRSPNATNWRHNCAGWQPPMGSPAL